MLWNYIGESCSDKEGQPLRKNDIVIARSKAFSGNATSSVELDKSLNYHIGRVVNFWPVSFAALKRMSNALQESDKNLGCLKHPLASMVYEVVEASGNTSLNGKLWDALHFESSFQRKKRKLEQQTSSQATLSNQQLPQVYGVVTRFDKYEDIENWFESSPKSEFLQKAYRVRVRVTDLLADCYLYRVDNDPGEGNVGGDILLSGNLELKPLFPYANFDNKILRDSKLVKEVINVKTFVPYCVRKSKIYFYRLLRTETVQFIKVDSCQESDLELLILDVQEKYQMFYRSSVQVLKDDTATKIHTRVLVDRGINTKNDTIETEVQKLRRRQTEYDLKLNTMAKLIASTTTTSKV